MGRNGSARSLLARGGAALLAIGIAALAVPDPVLPAAAAGRTPGTPRSPIEHIVFVAKENRSFDHYFGAFPDAGNDLNQSTTARCYRKSNPSVVDSFTMPAAHDPMPQDVSHANSTFYTAYHNGKMDGFCHERGAVVSSTGEDIADSQMRTGDIPNYWSYAKKYGIGDRMFASWRGASFGNNVFAVAAQTGRYSTVLGRRAIYGNPQDPQGGSHTWGCNNSANTTVSMIDLQGKLSDVFPCFSFPSMPNLLDDAGLDWRYYSAQDGSHFVHSGVAAIRSLRCAPGDAPPCTGANPYWDSHVVDGTKILSDAANGTLPAVSWYLAKETEHPPKTACAGENATVRAVNAIMQGPEWDSTAVVVWWDEWGGFYDHVKPPTIDHFGYGFRVPLIVLSPYAKQGYIDHSTGEFDSMLKFIEDNWGLAPLTSRDANAPSLADVFDFSQAPTKPDPLPLRTDCVGPKWTITP